MSNYMTNSSPCSLLYFKNPITGKKEKMGMTIGYDISYEKEGNDNMNNKVLELYKERKIREINKEYNAIYQEEYNKLPEVKGYKELVDEFQNNMEKLVNDYNREDYKPFLNTGYNYDFKYELTSEIVSKIKERHEEDYDSEREELKKLIEEVSAQLSLSDDKDYQIEVLKKYGILDSKGKLNV